MKNPFDDDTPGNGAPTNGSPLNGAPSPPVAIRQRPYCPRHNCLMQALGTTASATRYRCPVPNCPSDQQFIPRPRTRTPHEPQYCAQCTPPPAMEVNADRSGALQLVLQCPACGWRSIVPRPDLHYRLQQLRRPRTLHDR